MINSHYELILSYEVRYFAFDLNSIFRFANDMKAMQIQARINKHFIL